MNFQTEINIQSNLVFVFLSLLDCATLELAEMKIWWWIVMKTPHTNKYVLNGTQTLQSLEASICFRSQSCYCKWWPLIWCPTTMIQLLLTLCALKDKVLCSHIRKLQNLFICCKIQHKCNLNPFYCTDFKLINAPCTWSVFTRIQVKDTPQQLPNNAAFIQEPGIHYPLCLFGIRHRLMLSIGMDWGNAESLSLVVPQS